MLEVLKFVQGAVAKKDFVPALGHFRIRNNRIIGFNGALAISAPIALDLDVTPKASQFVKAIAACNEKITISIADNGKLAVKSGNFKTLVDCIAPEGYPEIKPIGQIIELKESILPALRYLQSFIAEDASRPWACGILFSGQSAFATNNIILLEYWLGFDLPFQINIPGSAVRELVRIGEDPIKLQMTDDRIIFHYADGRWLSTQVLSGKWPDASGLLNRHAGAEVLPFPAGFWEALEQLAPFTDELGKCYLLGDRMATNAASDQAGSSVAIDCPASGIFNANQLLNLKGIADQIGFASYPNPVPFFGSKTRGIIVGIKS